ncbi:DNA topoisomerase VI subunit B [Candidatus Woesearchaeota archaeon]|nr:DNA topoisomerase VI subunit B [Candidatus Woesearchaeota archaeon]
MTTIAEELAKKQREISVAEFFERNRHLLGFDNKRKALLTVVKEAVDNSLDACEEARVLPDIHVEIVDMENDRFRVIVTDNGPGIVKKQIPNIFAKLLYGSKFHTMKQSLCGDEPIVVQEGRRIRVIPIGELVDRHLHGEGEINCSHLDLHVPAFDLKTYTYSFQPVSHLIKHKRQNEIYRIKTAYGKEIKVTGCHSLFTIDRATLAVKDVQARDLRPGDTILAPKRLDIPVTMNEINLLDFIDAEYARLRFWYVYTDKRFVESVFAKATVVHAKKGAKSRKYYRFIDDDRAVEILDDSYKQYTGKGFLPVWLVKFVKARITEGVIKTYYHGTSYTVPLVWPLTPSLMQFLGLYVAEGHADARQIGFTFGKHERDLVQAVCTAGLAIGASHTVEERPAKNCVRVKLFGGLLSHLMKQWCGAGAKRKKAPSFVFTASPELRQDFVDYLYRGDGHNTKNRNQLMLSTVSRQLANEVSYLWLMQGVVASISTHTMQGLGKTPSEVFVVSVYGTDITASHVYTCNRTTGRRKCDPPLQVLAHLSGRHYTKEQSAIATRLGQLGAGPQSRETLANVFDRKKIGYKLRYLLDEGYATQDSNGLVVLTEKAHCLCAETEQLQKLLASDLLFLPVKTVERVDEGYVYVYDVSVPGCENFVGGLGALACHNSRGQQGIGISAAVLYAQLTTGRPARITSKIAPKEPAHYYELHVNTQTNQPEIVKEDIVSWNKDHGTKVELDIEANYQKGDQSVDSYLRETSIVNPHATIVYVNPKAEQLMFARATDKLPPQPKEIKPHPYGVELGIMMKMLKATESRTLQSFLTNEFSRVGGQTAHEICDNAGLFTTMKPAELQPAQVEKLMEGIKKTKIIAPSTDCIVPIGEQLLEKGLKKEVSAEFYVAVSRSPEVYKGIPFVVECALAFGGNQPSDQPATLLRFANRVPLLYQQGACAVFKSVVQTNWKPYGLQQSQGALPVGPLTVALHLASVWPPFTSEAKEAVAHYPEIVKEMKLALQEAGRKLSIYVHRKQRAHAEQERVGIFETYIPEVADALATLAGTKSESIEHSLKAMLKKNKEIIQQGLALPVNEVEGTGRSKGSHDEDES